MFGQYVVSVKSKKIRFNFGINTTFFTLLSTPDSVTTKYNLYGLAEHFWPENIDKTGGPVYESSTIIYK